LDYVSQDFEQRGVYQEKKAKAAKSEAKKEKSQPKPAAKKGSKK